MRSRARYLVCIAMLATLSGCARTVVKQPLMPTVSKIKDPLTAELAFWHGLESQPITCNDDAFHGLLLFLDDKDSNTDYAARVAELKARKLIPDGFDRPGNEAVRRGVVAYAVLQALKIHGGWVISIFGPSQRYAVRELMDLNLFPRSSPEQTFSGSEFVGIIGRVEDYQDGENAFIPAQTLRPQASGD